MGKQANRGWYEYWLKRLIDIALAGIAIIALSPLLGLSAFLVRVKLGKPVLFKQARPGKEEKIFYLYKFRSMTDAVDAQGKPLSDAERLTKFGKLLRKSSIDELPELVNILKGDMSIVGPRPLSIYYLPHYSKVEKHRHDVRPGLTGLAQVNGRNNLPWNERLSYDVQYVENVSFWGDFKIVLKTAAKVLKATDISVRGTTKVSDFGTYKRIQEEVNQTEMMEYKMSYTEIGSYFWLDQSVMADDSKQVTFLPEVADASFAFSGRAAIEVAIRDALKYRTIKKAYVPSYCCVSMLQSLIDHGIAFDFYNVEMKNGVITYDIDVTKKCDLFLFMRYFCIKSNGLDQMIAALKQKQVVIIEDITHSLFSEKVYFENSDYVVASLRKWFPTPAGGWVGKLTGTLAVKPDKDSDQVVEDKIKGMRMKAQYMNGDLPVKEEFLMINSKFDNDLIHVDRMLKADSTTMKILASTEIESVKNRRRKNAQILKDGLRDVKEIMLPEMESDQATPLFYPVFLQTEDRDSLRIYLTQRGIYCPVHWNEVMGAKPGIRANELSLVCDQRYTDQDMHAICNCICDWSKNK